MAVCADNASQLRSALERYVAEHGKFPDADDWREALRFTTEGQDGLVCPEAPQVRFGYAFNAALSGLDLDAVEDPKNTVVIFESDCGPAAGGSELLPSRPRHLTGDYYLLADMSVSRRYRKRLGTDSRGNPIWAREPDADWLIWEPALKESEHDP